MVACVPEHLYTSRYCDSSSLSAWLSHRCTTNLYTTIHMRARQPLEKSFRGEVQW